MAEFYAEVTGSRGTMTKLGTKETGLRAHVRGRRIGAYVEMIYNPSTKMDEVYLHVTGGSGSPATKKMIGAWDENWDKIL